MSISSAQQLGLYNEALTLCGERTLASLTENREPRRLLDQAWTDGNGGAVQFCLEKGYWPWAIRSQQYSYSPSIQPAYGYNYAFNQPTDMVKTASVCIDQYYNVPLTQYEDEGGFWYADLQNLYIKYVSNDPSFGLNYSGWSQTFIEFVAIYMGNKICWRLTQDEKKTDRIEKMYRKRLAEARSESAMEQPAKIFPQGAWAGARFGRFFRGNRGGNGGNY